MQKISISPSLKWDHTDNEIIAAAKKIAYLLAHLSDLVSSGRGTKKELIACSKGLAEVSERITELAKEYAKHCTDKKIRTNLLQVKFGMKRSKLASDYTKTKLSFFSSLLFSLIRSARRFPPWARSCA